MDSLAKPTKLRKGQNVPSTTAPSHASRLIVRNIPFEATEQDIRAVFLPYGPIYSIHIPLDDVQGEQSANEPTPARRKLRTKGFAFVWMLSKKDAEKVIEGCNGTVLRAGIAQSLVSDKQKKKKERRLEAKRLKGTLANKEKVDEEDAEEKEENRQQEETNKSTERVIAVDWALSKDRWEEERAKMEDVEMDNFSESETINENDGSDGETDSADDHLGVHDGESQDNESESDEEEEDENERVKPQLPPPETGTTIFIRNVPFEATEDELRAL